MMTIDGEWRKCEKEKPKKKKENGMKEESRLDITYEEVTYIKIILCDNRLRKEENVKKEEEEMCW